MDLSANLPIISIADANKNIILAITYRLQVIAYFVDFRYD